MYYTLHTARTKDRVGILRILAILSSCKNDRAYEDPFLHSLVSFKQIIKNNPTHVSNTHFYRFHF